MSSLKSYSRKALEVSYISPDFNNLSKVLPLINHITSPVIIIGMHRSGTSLLSRVFNKAGVFQGVFRDHNHEAFHFLSINQQTLQKSGNDWLNPSVPEKVNYYSISAEELYAIHFQISSNRIKRTLSTHRWGWKDPRNTFTLPMYLELFPKAKVVHLIRDGKEVAMSLKKRNDTTGEVIDERLSDLNFGFKLWEKYLIQGSSYRNTMDAFLELRYEDLIQKNESTIKALKGFLDIDISPYLNVVKKLPGKKFPQELTDLSKQSEVYKKWYAS